MNFLSEMEQNSKTAHALPSSPSHLYDLKKYVITQLDNEAYHYFLKREELEHFRSVGHTTMARLILYLSHTHSLFN